MESEETKPRLHYGIVNFERRTFPRFSVDLPVEYEQIDSFIPAGRALDIGEGGLLIYKTCLKTPGFEPGDEWHPFEAKRRPFPALSGMVEGHARHARGLKPRALARGVGSFNSHFTSLNSRSLYCGCFSCSIQT